MADGTGHVERIEEGCVMSSSPGEYNNKRAWMPDDSERIKLERRLVRAIQAGRPITQLIRGFGLSAARIKAVAKKHGLTIARGSGGNRL